MASWNVQHGLGFSKGTAKARSVRGRWNKIKKWVKNAKIQRGKPIAFETKQEQHSSSATQKDVGREVTASLNSSIPLKEGERGLAILCWHKMSQKCENMLHLKERQANCNTHAQHGGRAVTASLNSLIPLKEDKEKGRGNWLFSVGLNKSNYGKQLLQWMVWIKFKQGKGPLTKKIWS